MNKKKIRRLYPEFKTVNGVLFARTLFVNYKGKSRYLSDWVKLYD